MKKYNPHVKWATHNVPDCTMKEHPEGKYYRVIDVDKHHPKLCPTCDKPASYSNKWDAYYCHPTRCNMWLEKPCGDPACPHSCDERPEKPPI